MSKARRTATPSQHGATGAAESGRSPAVPRAIVRGLSPLVRISDEQGYRFLSYLLSMALCEARALAKRDEPANGGVGSGLLDRAKGR